MEEDSYSEICASSYNTEVTFITRKLHEMRIHSSSALTGNDSFASANNSTNYSSPDMVVSDESSDTNAVFEVGTLAMMPEVTRRSSLWKLFDPLVNSVNNDAEKVTSENCENIPTDREKTIVDKINCDIGSRNELLNKNLSSIPVGKTLISFESPKKPLVPKYLSTNSTEPFKKYTEDEFRHILKTQERRLQAEFTNKFNEYKMRFAENDTGLEQKLHKLVKLNKTYHALSSEFVPIVSGMSAGLGEMKEKMKNLSLENNQLKTDIKTTKENVSDVESSFSDLNKHYEQSKGMIKTFKENDELLLKNIEMIQASIDEQDNLNSILESRIRDNLEKANEEVESVKKSSETQVTVLKTQLKKSEMKICSLEREFEQAKSDNYKLGSISDDLMSKISG